MTFVEFAGLTQEAASLVEGRRLSPDETKSDIIVRVLSTTSPLLAEPPRSVEPTLDLGQGVSLKVGETMHLFLSEQSKRLRHPEGQAEVRGDGLYMNGKRVKPSRGSAHHAAMKQVQEKRNHRNEKGELISLSAWRQWHVERNGRMISLDALKSPDLAHRRSRLAQGA